jgi:hypothetical protein
MATNRLQLVSVPPTDGSVCPAGPVDPQKDGLPGGFRQSFAVSGAHRTNCSPALGRRLLPALGG